MNTRLNIEAVPDNMINIRQLYAYSLNIGLSIHMDNYACMYVKYLLIWRTLIMSSKVTFTCMSIDPFGHVGK